MPERSQYRIIEGGTPRAYKGAAAKRNIERAQHGLVVKEFNEVTTTVPAEHRQFVFDLRRGRRRIYGALLRVIDLLHARGTSKETALLIPGWIAAYIDEVWGGTPTRGAVPVELVTTGEFEKAA